MGDDTTPGQGLMEMILPEACMDKPEAVDSLYFEALNIQMLMFYSHCS